MRGLVPPPRAVGVERFKARSFGDDHVQRATLHGRLAQPQCFEQRSGPAASAQDDALRADLAFVHFQADQRAAFQQRFDFLAGDQAIACQIGQPLDQARHVDDQFGQAIDFALKRLSCRAGGS